MSASQSDADILGQYRASAYFGLQCCIVSTLAFVVYDWLVTLSREVDLFWTGNARPLSTMLYLANKYLNLLSYVVTGVQMAPTSNKSCAQMAVVFRVFLCLSYVPPAVFTTLRAYALTRRMWLCIFVFALSVTQVVTPMVAFIVYPVIGIYSSTWGCIGGTAVPLSSDPLGQMYDMIVQSSLSSSCANRDLAVFFLTYRASIILADTMLVVITWKFLPASSITTYVVPMKGRRPNALASIMRCNGILYFIVLSMLNILQLVVMVGFPVVMEGVVMDVSYLTAPVSSVLVSHFLLDLQEAYQKTTTVMVNDNASDTSLDTGGSIQFASALGSVAAITGLAADQVQEAEGVGVGDGIGGGENLTAEEGVGPDEGEAVHESQSEDEFAIMEVPRIEDEFAITEVPRVGAGEVTVGTL